MTYREEQANKRAEYFISPIIPRVLTTSGTPPDQWTGLVERGPLQWTLEQHGFELRGSTYIWTFSINTCIFWFLVGSPRMWRADHRHWYMAFYMGAWASTGLCVFRGSWNPSSVDTKRQLYVWGIKKLSLDSGPLGVWELVPLTPTLIKGQLYSNLSHTELGSPTYFWMETFSVRLRRHLGCCLIGEIQVMP